MLTKEEDDAELNRASDKLQEQRDEEAWKELERDRLKARLVAMGYDLDQLDQDNPYLQF